MTLPEADVMRRRAQVATPSMTLEVKPPLSPCGMD
jgi:hypothetical protein